jgi:diaminopimelate epimerase
MGLLSFEKYEGLGNDFILVETGDPSEQMTPESAQRLCDRRRGIGADGVLWLFTPERDIGDAHASLTIWNADGSVAEMCGNGLRCVVRHLSGRISGRLKIRTGAGMLTGWLAEDGRITVTLGRVTLTHASVACPEFSETPAPIGVSVGNPHLVLSPMPEGVSLVEMARALGPQLTHHEAFSRGTNVEFVRLRGPQELELVVYERGAGLTEACGTGAAASVAALRHWGLIAADAPVAVELPGGRLDVRLATPIRGVDLGLVEITGPAEHVFSGQLMLALEDIVERKIAPYQSE